LFSLISVYILFCSIATENIAVYHKFWQITSLYLFDYIELSATRFTPPVLTASSVKYPDSFGSFSAQIKPAIAVLHTAKSAGFTVDMQKLRIFKSQSTQ
jgi:hypothetical protein